MTTLNEAREACYLRFRTLFTGLPTERITFDNEDFDEPDKLEWARLVVRSFTRGQNTMGGVGSRRFRSTASVLVQVYALSNTGVKQLDLLAEEAKNVFEGVSFSGLDFLAADIRETGADGKWNQHVVEIEFDFDEIK